MAQIDRAKLTSGIVLALTAACSTASLHQSASGGDGGKGHGGSTSSATTSTTSTSTTSTTTTTTSSAIATGTGGLGGAGGAGGMGGMGGMGGSGVDTCNPAPDPSTLWAQQVINYPSFTDGTLCQHVGDVLLVVNTAAA